MNDNEIKQKLYMLKKKRTYIYVVMGLLFSMGALNEFTSLIPDYVMFIFIGVGILALIPFVVFVSLSTCPKCNNNYFGGFPPRIDRKKCAFCGLELNEAIKPYKVS